MNSPAFVRRRLVAASGALVLLSAALSAGTATALAPAAGPGSPRQVSSQHRYANIDGGNWSGVVVSRGSSYSSVSATWTEPKVSCTHRKNLMAPWVGLDGWGSSTVQQTGVETSCSSGKPRYRAWYEVFPAPPVYFGNTVRAGDTIKASVVRRGDRYTLKISNSTRHWTRTITRTKHAKHTSAEVILESPTGAYPKFSQVKFRDVKVNQKSVHLHPHSRLDASNSHGRENVTSTVTRRGAFSISYKRE